MAGGTLMVSRAVCNFEYYKNRLLEFGYHDVTVTALERDALFFLIRDLKPSLILMSARFYHCCTPFMMGELHKKFPKIKMAALCLGEYPPDIAMYFILNGIKSYFTSFEGVDQFRKGLKEILKGRDFISPAVMERINMRLEYPEPAGKITGRHLEIIRLVCCGFRDMDIAELMAIAKSTVENYKTEIYTTLNVRNAIELIRAALTLKIMQLEELYFYPRDFTLNPKPDKK